MNIDSEQYGIQINPQNPQEVHCSYEEHVARYKEKFTRHSEETQDQYYDRLIGVYRELFAEEGGVFLLPHHYQDLFGTSLKQYQLTFEQRKQIFLSASDDRKSTTGLIPHLSRVHPQLAEVDSDTNWQTPYYQPGFRSEESKISSAALLEAMIQTDQPIVICHNTFKDPQCLSAGIFDGGLHCRAEFIMKAKNLVSYGDLGDADIFIHSLHELEQLSEFHSWLKQEKIKYHQPGEKHLQTWIYLDHDIALSERGMDLYMNYRRNQILHAYREMEQPSEI